MRIQSNPRLGNTLANETDALPSWPCSHASFFMCKAFIKGFKQRPVRAMGICVNTGIDSLYVIDFTKTIKYFSVIHFLTSTSKQMVFIQIGRNRLIDEQDVVINSSSFGSWPKSVNYSQRLLRTQQTRTMSEPIMVANGRPIVPENGGPLGKSSSGPGPPRTVSLSFNRKITPVDMSDIPDVPFIFILGKKF